MSTLYNGWTKHISNEEQRANELAATIELLVAEPDNTYWQTRLAVIRDDVDEELTDALHDLIKHINTDPEHVLNAAQEVEDWMQRDDAAAQYGNYFYGGDVHEFTPYRQMNGGDDDMPF
jgi:hypothetical protein